MTSVKDAQKAFNNATKEVTKAKLLLITIERGQEDLIQRYEQAKTALAQAELLLHDAAREVVEASISEFNEKEQQREEARRKIIEAVQTPKPDAS